METEGGCLFLLSLSLSLALSLSFSLPPYVFLFVFPHGTQTDTGFFLGGGVIRGFPRLQYQGACLVGCGSLVPMDTAGIVQ